MDHGKVMTVYCVGTLSMPSSRRFLFFFFFFFNTSNHLMIYHLMPCEKW